MDESLFSGKNNKLFIVCTICCESYNPDFLCILNWFIIRLSLKKGITVEGVH